MILLISVRSLLLNHDAIIISIESKCPGNSICFFFFMARPFFWIEFIEIFDNHSPSGFHTEMTISSKYNRNYKIVTTFL